jgi:hypothetical protein
MNNRVKELMLDAGYAAPELALRARKLVELIVNECANVVDVWSDEIPCSEGYDKFTVGKIKEHFGVEE